jgi:hypothetical protein
MTAQTVPTETRDLDRRRAADLRSADRIVPDLLGDAVEEVLGVYPYADHGGQHALVVSRDDLPGPPSIHFFRADDRVALVAAGADVPDGVAGCPIAGRAERYAEAER